ncbi:MAG TPA: radical SAM protein [Proteobacteria bacterium]|nr:radical SAM protein [Pseudomonadota bacterium]
MVEVKFNGKSMVRKSFRGDPAASERRLFQLAAGKPCVALVFPNDYSLAVSNLGYLWAWRMFNEHGLRCERFVVPSRQRSGTKADRSIPRSLDSGERLNRFPLIAFSLCYENDYVRALRFLLAAGIPPLSRKRTRADPIVFAGGIAITANPAPLAEVLDFVVLGELEPIAGRLCEALEMWRGQNRTGFLRSLAEIEGVYVPRIHGTPEEMSGRAGIEVQKHRQPRFAYSPLLTDRGEFGNAFLIELGRGCPSLCRFCLIGHVSLPPRYADLTGALDALEASGASRVGLLASDVAGHPGFNRLLAELVDRGLEVSVSSLRMGTKADYRLLAEAGLKQITLAPECGSVRIRTLVNKRCGDDEVIDEMERALDAGIERIKLYFMVGLPTESSEDALRIATLVEKARGALGKRHRLLVSVAPFVPKPHTPFELVPFAGERAIKERFNLLRSRLARIPNVEFEIASAREAKYQAYISRAGSEAARILIASAQTGKNIEHAARDLGVDLDEAVGRDRSPDELLPWKFVDTKVKHEFLVDQYHLALDGKAGPKCRVGRCTVCGVCGSD